MPIEEFDPGETARLYTRESGMGLETGDAVKTGQRLAPDLVSPVTGTVAQIEPFNGIDGQTLTSIALDVAAEEEMAEGLESVTDFSDDARDALLSTLSDLGFNVNLGSDVDAAVISCVDTDPLHTVNQQTFRESANTLPDAISLLKALTGAKRVLVAITRQLQGLARRHVDGHAEMLLLDAFYPNGLPEVILRKASRKYAGMNSGLVVGVERLFAMVTALKDGKPIQDKLVTLSVPSAGLCKTLRVRIGTRIGDVLDAHEVTLGENSKLVTGGAMRGIPCYSTDFAVTPETDSICVQDETRVVEHRNTPCLNCGKCSAVCPMDLRVNLICRYSEYALFDECQKMDVDDCIECGLCAYACTARRPLIHYLKLAKAELAKKTEE